MNVLIRVYPFDEQTPGTMVGTIDGVDDMANLVSMLASSRFILFSPAGRPSVALSTSAILSVEPVNV